MINQKYKIKKLLGKGRSTVYLGEDVEFPGKEIAIKILPDDFFKNLFIIESSVIQQALPVEVF